MAAESNQGSGRFAVEIAKDLMQAVIRLRNGNDVAPATAEDVMNALRKAGVVVNEAVRARVEEYVKVFAQPDARSKPFVIAVGRPMVKSRHGQFTWHESFAKKGRDWFDEEPVDFHSFNSIVTVEKDAVLGTITPAVPGEDGLDVCGHVLKDGPPPNEVRLDPSVRRSEKDPNLVVANVAGKAVFEKGFVAVREAVEVPGDVDYQTGNINSAVAVSIRGTVLDSFEVKCQKSITVSGAIQAATVSADEDIVVRGGILGRRRGKVSAGGNITAKYVEDADVEAKGDVRVARGVMGSRVQAYGRLVSPRGAIIGGEVYGREGIEVAALGSEACVPTSVAVGIHPDLIRQADMVDEETKTKRQTIERIRGAVKPLLTDLKRLTPSQKERATELMFQADSMEAEIAETEKRRDAMLEAARAQGIPYVSVTKKIHQRVQIRIGRRHVVFDQDLAGPIRIEKRKVNGVTEFVSVNQLSGSVTVLPSTVVEGKAADKPSRTPPEACKA